MPVLSRVDDRLKFATKHFPEKALLDRSRLYWAFNQGRECPLDEDHLMGEEDKYQQPVLYKSVFSQGMQIRKEIALDYGNKVYPLLIPYACSTMLFNARALEEIHSYRKAHGIPINWKSIGIDNNNQKSVGIHIRRSDKVYSGESTAFEAALYVQKIINVTGGLEKARKSISHCFLASDEYNAVIEIKEALVEKEIPCKIYSLVNDERKGTSHQQQRVIGREDTLVFLTEVSLLIESSYFIGSMNSNVGCFVTLMRSCPSYEESAGDIFLESYLESHEYFHSYGVDSDSWFNCI